MAGASAQGYALKGYLDGELFELEKEIGRFGDLYEELDGVVMEMK